MADDPRLLLAKQTLAGSTNDWVGRAQQHARHIVEMDAQHAGYVAETDAVLARMVAEVEAATERLGAALSVARDATVASATAKADLLVEAERRAVAEGVARDVLDRLEEVAEGAYRIRPGARRVIERHREVIAGA